jgi:carbamoyltransferase
MIIWGISANSHDAALAVFKNNELVFASHSERFSGKKNDPDLCSKLVNHAIIIGGVPDLICWYENPFVKSIRQLWAGQGFKFSKNNIKRYLENYGISAPIVYIDHHKSHAAAAYYTAPWDNCAVLCVDSIGEFTTTSIWQGTNGELKRLERRSYPNSLGLFYSAMTQKIGLKPQEDEYILMGMAAYGDSNRLYDRMMEDFFNSRGVKVNFHRGAHWWGKELIQIQDLFDIAAATQRIYEEQFEKLLKETKFITGADKIALAGGCALNCVANVIAWKYFQDVWIFPNPGDAGSSVGAVLAHTQQKIKINDCYFGFNIYGDYPVKAVLKNLLQGVPVGVANGRAEFGPRALGNRSLLADPRSNTVKERVNDIKRRQQFRPFAPAILEEFAYEYFDLPGPSPFMQYAVPCLRPEELPGIVHADGTSRVQTVPPDDSGFRKLLEAWYEKTGCPVLLNTSLNIKGQPIVNDRNDADQFQTYYNVPVHLHQM